MATAPRTYQPTAQVQHWQGQLLWVLGAGVFGFAMTEIFSSLLQISRGWWVLIYSVAVAVLSTAYVRWANVNVLEMMRRHWLAGVILGALIAIVLTFSITGSQTASPRDQGLTFVWDIVWYGVVYGTADAMLLNVIPVYALWQASSDLGHTKTWPGKIMTGALALVASLLVTTMYHAGYAEFRGSDIGQPMFGNTLISLAYVLSGNPISAFAGHIALHVSSVVHGFTSTTTLPPHY